MQRYGATLANEIPNSELTSDAIPGPTGGWVEIGRFALTYDGHMRWGSFEKCAEIANARRDDTLDELRTCSFFEQRRWRHFGEGPDVKARARKRRAGSRYPVVLCVSGTEPSGDYVDALPSGGRRLGVCGSGSGNEKRHFTGSRASWRLPRSTPVRNASPPL